MTTKDVWYNFVQSHDTQSVRVPHHILDSWQYCSKLEVNPYSDRGIERISVYLLQEQRTKLARLIRMVQDEIQKYSEFFYMKRPLFILTDENGAIIWRDGHRQTKELANDILFSEGSVWTEKAVGTNAIGITLRTKQTNTVKKYEHYAKASHPFICSSAPVLDAENQLIACLNVSTTEEDFETNYTQIALQMITKSIHIKLLEESYHEQAAQMKTVLKQPFHACILCNEAGKIMAISNDFEEQEKDWLGRIAEEFIAQKGLNYTVKQLFNRTEKIGLAYLFEIPELVQSTGFTSFGVPSRNAHYRRFLAQLLKSANSDLPIHICGETGSGKEISAKTIHYNSPRNQGPLISVNCGALSENLLESELFGYASGAFTGANQSGYQGKIRQADKGTLFLDEVDSMSPRMQVSLLRVLEEKKVVPLGGESAIDVDFRIVTASNKDLRKLVLAGEFRADLFYRLFVLPLRLPPLREREEDFDLFIDSFCEKNSWYPDWICDVKRKVPHYEWPGNIREFYNFVERLHLFYHDHAPTSDEIDELINQGSVKPNEAYVKQQAGELSERDQILLVLQETNNHLSQTAEKLGIARSTLYRKLDKYQITIEK